MITNGFVDWAVKRPGPVNKLYGETSSMSGLVCHSMEGWLAGSLGELDKPDRQASWHFSNALDGTLYQHYPLQASVWASGNYKANTSLIAVESEGVAGTPLNAAQVATMLNLAQEIEAYRGYKLVRQVTLWEHNEVALWAEPNAGPTSCPSHRYDPFFAALLAEPQQEADMTPDEITKIAQAAAEAFIGTNFRTYLDLALNGGPGQFADANGKPLPLVRDEDVVTRVAALEASKPGGEGTANELVDGDTVTLTRVKK